MTTAPVVLPGDDMRLYRRGGIYHLDYGESKGRRLRRSLKTRDPVLAQQVLTLAKAEAVQDRAGLMARASQSAASISWEQALDEWWATSKARHSPITRSKVRPRVKRWRKVFAGPLTALDRSTLERYVAKRMADGCRGNTVRTELAILAGILAHQVELGRLRENPAKGIKVRAEPPPERWITLEEMDEIAMAAPEPWATVYRMTFLTGFRKGEILNLTWDRVDFVAREIRLSKTVTWAGPKGLKARTYPIADRVFALLREQHRRSRESRYVFPSPVTGRPYRDGHYAWKRDLKRAGFVGPKHLRFQDLRHSWASSLLRKGANPRVVQELGGWSNLRMLQRYTHVSAADHREAAEMVATPARNRHTSNGGSGRAEE